MCSDTTSESCAVTQGPDYCCKYIEAEVVEFGFTKKQKNPTPSLVGELNVNPGRKKKSLTHTNSVFLL